MAITLNVGVTDLKRDKTIRKLMKNLKIQSNYSLKKALEFNMVSAT